MTHERETGRRNHLEGQTSPYLLQHLYNPVDWRPWGPDALALAAEENRPIFLSIGYAACHWCHVMERESFEDPDVAGYLNEHFVPIKVDREERPDLDEIYMSAVQMLTGQGGWPMSVFLTPGGEPFAGGTYFPPVERHGLISFPELLRRVHEAWTGRHEDVARAATELRSRIEQVAHGAVGQADAATIGRADEARAVAELAQRFDRRWGGFGQAPKFPPDGAMRLLLREHARTGERVPLDMVTRTLDAMALGGMYDQLGGGFSRYSVDEQWLVPHFEKMLYNQALLVPLYLDAWRLTGTPLYSRVAAETLDFVRRELTDPSGGFHSSLDADSEGHEGRFYVWSPDEIEQILGSDEGRLVGEIYDILPGGNFEGLSIPNLLSGSLARRAEERGEDEPALVARLAPLRARLLEARESRVRPGTDDKVLTAWNGLMITAFAAGYQALGRPEDLEAARQAADFALSTLQRNGRLLVSYREGHAELNGYLDDYAFLARGLIDLYEAGFESADLLAAEGLARTMIRHFQDDELGGFYFVSDDHERLLTRFRSSHDGALPSGAGVAAETLLRLSAHLDDDDLREAAHRTLSSCAPAVTRFPSQYAALLTAGDLAGAGTVEVAVIGAKEDPLTRDLLAIVRARYVPGLVLAHSEPGTNPDRLALLRGRTDTDRPVAHVCRNQACLEPTSDPAQLSRALDEVVRHTDP